MVTHTFEGYSIILNPNNEVSDFKKNSRSMKSPAPTETNPTPH